MSLVRLAVLGAGLIGARHADVIAASPVATLAAIADPSPAGRAVAGRLGVPHFTAYEELLAAGGLDGVVIALPNQMHTPAAVACIARGLPCLVEKPLADTLEAGAEIVRASEARGVPVLVGHHRRYNPIVETTKALVAEGRLGRLVAAHVMWATMKPLDYFDVAWRREAGGGPILINLIHDIDCLRHLLGEIAAVQAFVGSDARAGDPRGIVVEDTAAIALRFTSGVLATITLTDAAPSPWTWEAGSADNPGIAASGQNAMRLLGSEAALDFPNLTLWRHGEGRPRSWAEPMSATTIAVPSGEALPAQIAHMAAVIRGQQVPRITARDGFDTLAATLAVKQAAASGGTVVPQRLDGPRSD